jgi:hypothetical protein
VPKKSKPKVVKTPKPKKPKKVAVVPKKWSDLSSTQQKEYGTEKDYDGLDDSTKNALNDLFVFLDHSYSIYTATLTTDSAKEQGKTSFEWTDCNDDDALTVINAMVGLNNVQTITAKLLSNNTVRNIEIPPEPSESPSNPFDDPFYAGESEDD